MGIQPNVSQLVYRCVFEHKEISAAGYRVLFDLLAVLGRKDVDFVNSLLVMVNPQPDMNSDFAQNDSLEIQMGITVQGVTRTQKMKASGNWFTSDGDSPTNPYWTFYPYCVDELQYDSIRFSTALTSWLVTETMRALFFVEVYSLPNSHLPVLKP